jgi:hypothetical protein
VQGSAARAGQASAPTATANCASQQRDMRFSFHRSCLFCFPCCPRGAAFSRVLAIVVARVWRLRPPMSVDFFFFFYVFMID